MVKLTRLNNQVVVINPDHIAWADASPDTVLFLLNGEKIMVRETFDELIERVVEYRLRTKNNGTPGDVISVEGLPKKGGPYVSMRPNTTGGATTRPNISVRPNNSGNRGER